jgi:hypothetical protein
VENNDNYPAPSVYVVEISFSQWWEQVLQYAAKLNKPINLADKDGKYYECYRASMTVKEAVEADGNTDNSPEAIPLPKELSTEMSLHDTIRAVLWYVQMFNHNRIRLPRIMQELPQPDDAAIAQLVAIARGLWQVRRLGDKIMNKLPNYLNRNGKMNTK